MLKSPLDFLPDDRHADRRDPKLRPELETVTGRFDSGRCIPNATCRWRQDASCKSLLYPKRGAVTGASEASFEPPFDIHELTAPPSSTAGQSPQAQLSHAEPVVGGAVGLNILIQATAGRVADAVRSPNLRGKFK